MSEKFKKYRTDLKFCLLPRTTGHCTFCEGVSLRIPLGRVGTQLGITTKIFVVPSYSPKPIEFNGFRRV